MIQNEAILKLNFEAEELERLIITLGKQASAELLEEIKARIKQLQERKEEAIKESGSFILSNARELGGNVGKFVRGIIEKRE